MIDDESDNDDTDHELQMNEKVNRDMTGEADGMN